MTQAKPQAAAVDLVTLTIDGTEISVPKGTLVIRAAELIGVQIPRFCDHPLLDPVGACRQCLIEVELPGREPGSAPVRQAKPFAACTTTVMEGMVVHTQHTSAAADKAQQGVMELLLVNHPLDCPVCDKGGECPLQNQAMSNGQTESRFTDVKRTFPKPIPISAQVLLDRERCVLCARCTRFSDQVAGDPFIELQERGALQQVGIYAKEPFESYFSGNTVQICPVGALTGASYRFRARPFDLVSSPGVCEHCASGCAQRTDHRRGKVLRRLAGDDPEVNEEWNCDKGRWAFSYVTERDRITTPLLRNAAGELVAASWPEALGAAARGLAAAGSDAGVLTGGRVTLEDAYAYTKFARLALRTNNIDFRSRTHSAEEADFLAARVAGNGMPVTYAQLEQAPVVLLAGLEPEEESPIVYLRLRKAARKHGLKVYSIAPFASSGLRKMSGKLLMTAPGDEGAALSSARAAELLSTAGAVILAGERLAESPGALSAAVRLADTSGAALAWVPRRAGDRGAVEAGAMPGLLPGGRPLGNATARAEVAALWQVPDIDGTPGADSSGLLSGEVAGLVLGGVDLDDLPDPAAARAGIERAGFVVSLELRHSTVTELADVVFPVAPTSSKAGTFLDWEGRAREFGPALPSVAAMPDLRVLDILAAEMGVPLGLPDAASARTELDRLGTWDGELAPPQASAAIQPAPGSGQAVLASWRMLLDAGSLQDGEPNLAATARRPVARMSAPTAAGIGATAGDLVTVSTTHGALTLPLDITDMAPATVWVPRNSAGSTVHRTLAAGAGALVSIARADGKASA